MKIGDLVTVLPAGGTFYLVVDLYSKEFNDAALGRLWELYGTVNGGVFMLPMHEKWIEVIDDV